jgi:hypothetical protein
LFKTHEGFNLKHIKKTRKPQNIWPDAVLLYSSLWSSLWHLYKSFSHCELAVPPQKGHHMGHQSETNQSGLPEKLKQSETFGNSWEQKFGVQQHLSCCFMQI